MVSIHETAYPRFKSDLTETELSDIYMPSEDEIAFCTANTQQVTGRLALLCQLKTTQRLGYFVKLIDIPQNIILYISRCIGAKAPSRGRLREFDQSGTRARRIALTRNYLNMRYDRTEVTRITRAAARMAAETKQELPDIINIIIEELVRHRCELPGFTVLLREAKDMRNQANNTLFKSIEKNLSGPEKKHLDTMLTTGSDKASSDWNLLKREPRRPTNKEVRSYLKHIEWLKSWVDRLPSINHIPAAKWRQFVLEARALDAADLKRVRPVKRYSLMVILIHAQLGMALDDAVEIFNKKVKSLHKLAQERLEEYHLRQIRRAEKLIGQFRDVLTLFHGESLIDDRELAISSTLGQKPEDVLMECEEHLAYAGNNYYPFMLTSYQPVRAILLNCLELLDVQSTSSDTSLVQAIHFLLKHRSSHKNILAFVDDVNGGRPLDLRWIPEKWRKLVLAPTTGAVPAVHRKYFELCVLTQVMGELKSGDLFIQHSDHYGDYRDQLIDWPTYEQQVQPYCEMMGITRDPTAFVGTLRVWLEETAERVDARFPENEYLEIGDQGIVLKRHATRTQPSLVGRIDQILTERLPQTNILDIIIQTESWLDLHRHFGPLSGFEAKLDDPRKRFITSLFCYGCNLGPSQTARSVKGFTRKQIAWLNLHHVTEERLDKAITEVINSYNRYRLPAFWGSGKHVSADGTKWNMYEQNLLSEYHIRYGGYGGIGYYHVSDKYIALFSHFIPCGVYEAIYILDGLINNESDISPDIIHGDTQAQSTPVFGLANLLGIKLMPRIRNLKDLVFYKADKGTSFKHIDKLFNGSVNWDIIATHLPDMLRIVLSIKAGKLTPSAILRRLGTYSRKNKIYFAFRELGRVVRTEFLLNYISDVDLRRMIQSSTNKSEEFNRFIKWLFFGGEGTIAQNIRHEQHKIIKYSHLVANMVILHNVDAMTRVFRDLIKEGYPITEEILAGFAPYRTENINRFGDYFLNLEQDFRPMSYKEKIL